MTDPISGWVIDGSSANSDIDYSHESAILESVWGNFSDAESGIDHFIVIVIINGNPVKELLPGIATSISDYSFHFAHNDRVTVKVEAINGASKRAASFSNGYLVDLTPAALEYLYDSKTGFAYQTSNTELYAHWLYSDPESGILKYQMKIEEYYAGSSKKIWPLGENYETFYPPPDNRIEITLTGFALINGAKYTVEVIAFNKALAFSKHVSSGVIVDTTAPHMIQV